MLKRAFSLLLLLTVSLIGQHAFAEPTIEFRTGGEIRTYSRQALLARSDLAEVHLPRDVAYGRPMTFRAVPLADLLDIASLLVDDVLETRAADGFAAQLPMDLVRNRNPDGAVAWLAIEDPAKPWPKLPGKAVSAGAFYLVWVGKEVSSVRNEQWPFQIVQFATQKSPVARWPALAVGSELSATDPVRAGQRLFITQCLACHRLNGAGSSDSGPDLNSPMNPVEYFQPAALHRYIRNPAAVRDWPGRIMPAFSQDQLSDREIDLIVAYLAHMARKKVGR
ncbi:c-type cytochrome [Burkholderia stagnalis]|uniref:c-type cytochrome n=1 Tax=Burkholderia stagnalis TaxID=1503054 RepID=UPI000F577945|nr:cytochrome c [Burkholderia stagnalis]RQP97312.1 cytochrome c [Burkholderia stagnalis]RQQ22383.1 cytochrome c [Burkholderia stagnalis]RQQ24534.1 cytochrome c [Burkholderia stagnalis]RQQ25470.1 cytochrome c [Burkholderia stagnalis]RQQ43163.1 cytochrome c [Burkholderia stagnalis]